MSLRSPWLSESWTTQLLVIALCRWSTLQRLEAIPSGHDQQHSSYPAFISMQNVRYLAMKLYLILWTQKIQVGGNDHCWADGSELATVRLWMLQLQPSFSKASYAAKTYSCSLPLWCFVLYFLDVLSFVLFNIGKSLWPHLEISSSCCVQCVVSDCQLI